MIGDIHSQRVSSTKYRPELAMKLMVVIRKYLKNVLPHIVKRSMRKGITMEDNVKAGGDGGDED